MDSPVVGPVESLAPGGAPALVRGITWSPDGPALSLAADDGDARLPLGPGLWLRFRVLSGPGVPARYCLGYSAVHGPTEARHHPCPTGQAAERGYQCGACFARDDFRFMHDFHRSGIAPPGLRAYLGQPHWLYVATFADGTVKVGTASQRSKWARLAEQGAIVARYVAHARDGSVVRLLEDAVSEGLGLTQFVRGTAKYAALLQPRPEADLDAANGAAADAVREFLDGVALDGFEAVSEQFEPHAFTGAVSRPGRRIAYPRPLDSGEHGMRLDSMVGSHGLVAVDGAESVFLADLAALKGHKIELGSYTTDIPALQESLF
ncbi:DUF2797 domain-containing protein [Arthrobacter wenxiniae]|uniref:DUF2797 domain-containing protein n=1 Tax=Arthrobacter wenxiniae TaxID=2713570 RepID=UPI0031B5824A